MSLKNAMINFQNLFDYSAVKPVSVLKIFLKNSTRVGTFWCYKKFDALKATAHLYGF
jgi:hypothetical protein